jgi:hypothetical protein
MGEVKNENTSRTVDDTLLGFLRLGIDCLETPVVGPLHADSGITTKKYTNATCLAPHLRPSGRSLGPLDSSELSSLVYPRL